MTTQTMRMSDDLLQSFIIGAESEMMRLEKQKLDPEPETAEELHLRSLNVSCVLCKTVSPKDPVFLACFRTVCFKCAVQTALDSRHPDGWSKSAINPDSQPNSDNITEQKNLVVNCVIPECDCKTYISKRMTNPIAADMSVSCSQHRAVTASWKCKECGLLCMSCFLVHIGERRHWAMPGCYFPLPVGASTPTCGVHPDTVAYRVCITCCTYLCSLCCDNITRGPHAGHSTRTEKLSYIQDRIFPAVYSAARKIQVDIKKIEAGLMRCPAKSEELRLELVRLHELFHPVIQDRLVSRLAMDGKRDFIKRALELVEALSRYHASLVRNHYGFLDDASDSTKYIESELICPASNTSNIVPAKHSKEYVDKDLRPAQEENIISASDYENGDTGTPSQECAPYIWDEQTQPTEQQYYYNGTNPVSAIYYMAAPDDQLGQSEYSGPYLMVPYDQTTGHDESQYIYELPTESQLEYQSVSYRDQAHSRPSLPIVCQDWNQLGNYSYNGADTYNSTPNNNNTGGYYSIEQPEVNGNDQGEYYYPCSDYPIDLRVRNGPVYMSGYGTSIVPMAVSGPPYSSSVYDPNDQSFNGSYTCDPNQSFVTMSQSGMPLFDSVTPMSATTMPKLILVKPKNASIKPMSASVIPMSAPVMPASAPVMTTSFSFMPMSVPVMPMSAPVMPMSKRVNLMPVPIIHKSASGMPATALPVFLSALSVVPKTPSGLTYPPESGACSPAHRACFCPFKVPNYFEMNQSVVAPNSFNALDSSTPAQSNKVSGVQNVSISRNQSVEPINQNDHFQQSLGGIPEKQIERSRTLSIDSEYLRLLRPECPRTLNVTRSHIAFHSFFGRTGMGPGMLNEPNGVALTDDGRILLADTNNHRIVEYCQRRQCYLMSKYTGTMQFPLNVAVYKQFLVVIERNPSSCVKVYNRQPPTFLRNLCAGSPLKNLRCLAVDYKGRIIVVQNQPECTATIYCQNLGGIIYNKFKLLDVSFPRDVCANEQEELFVVDKIRHNIGVFSYDGTRLRTLGGEGLTDFPIGVFINTLGHVFVVDNHLAFKITVLDQQGNYLYGFQAAKIVKVLNVAIDSVGTVAVTCEARKKYTIGLMNVFTSSCVV